MEGHNLHEGNRYKQVRLTPKDHHQRAEHHFHGPHIQVSIQLYPGLPSVLLHRTFEQDPV